MPSIDDTTDSGASLHRCLHELTALTHFLFTSQPQIGLPPPLLHWSCSWQAHQWRPCWQVQGRLRYTSSAPPLGSIPKLSAPSFRKIYNFPKNKWSRLPATSLAAATQVFLTISTPRPEICWWAQSNASCLLTLLTQNDQHSFPRISKLPINWWHPNLYLQAKYLWPPPLGWEGSY